MKVLINTRHGRKEVEAEVIKDNSSTVIVRLPDGNVVSRKKKRDTTDKGENNG